MFPIWLCLARGFGADLDPVFGTRDRSESKWIRYDSTQARCFPFPLNRKHDMTHSQTHIHLFLVSSDFNLIRRFDRPESGAYGTSEGIVLTAGNRTHPQERPRPPPRIRFILALSVAARTNREVGRGLRPRGSQDLERE